MLNVIQVDTHRLRAKPHGAITYPDLLGHLVDTKCTTVGEELFSGVNPLQHVDRCVAFHHIHKVFHVTRYMKADKITLQ